MDQKHHEIARAQAKQELHAYRCDHPTQEARHNALQYMHNWQTNNVVQCAVNEGSRYAQQRSTVTEDLVQIEMIYSKPECLSDINGMVQHSIFLTIVQHHLAMNAERRYSFKLRDHLSYCDNIRTVIRN